MDETEGLEEVKRRAILNSFLVLSGLVKQDGDSVAVYEAERPGPDWYAHGSFDKGITVLRDGVPVQIILRKPRWRLRGTNTTCHSRPPDDPVFVRYCTAIVVLRVAACLLGMGGFCRRTEMLPHLDSQAGSDRTVQRWLSRSLRNSLLVQQAIRQMILAQRRFEPRPQEDMFRRGRAPPAGLLLRYRSSTDAVSTLWRALDMLFVSANELPSDVALLLAEARRRWHAPGDIFPV